MQRVTGIGGVFVRARDAKELREWYAENLGIEISDYGGHRFDCPAGAALIWAVFDPESDYFGRRDQAYMINFRVDDLDAMLAQLRAAGAEVIDQVEESEFGRFGWAVDPEGNRFELWQAPPGY